MASEPSPASEAMEIITPREFRIERSLKRGDTTYELFVGPCACCDKIVYRLMRSCGASSISIYQISAGDADNLEAYVDELHADFAVDVRTKLHQLREAIAEFNSHGLFEAEELSSFRVRLIDKARLLSGRLSRTGALGQILNDPDNIENDISAAFLLGCLATEYSWLEAHEDAVFEGWAHMEGREVGRPLARAARLRQGKRSRKAVIDAVSKLYAGDPLLRRNDSKTANQIAAMKLEALRKRDNTFLGAEAIIKHIRAARQESQL